MGTEQGPRLCCRTTFALELVPAGARDGPHGSGSEGGAERRGGATSPLGVLAVRPPPASAGPAVEPQTRVPCLEGHEAQSAPASQAAPAPTGPAADGRGGPSQRRMGDGLHG